VELIKSVYEILFLFRDIKPFVWHKSTIW
jgi:hypothetical protein